MKRFSVKYLSVLGLIFVGLATATTAQFPQMERSRQRMEALRKADEARQHDERLANEAHLPVPKPAVMNVDVQIVLSKNEYKTFAEAKAAEAKKIVDGEPLWLYVKFKTKLGDYVLTTRHPDDRERLRYTLYAEVAPRGDITALNQYSIQFAKEDLPATELKIGLAPALFGRNKSIPVFLMTSSGIKSGVWNNELRLTNNITFPRGLQENLASAPITLDFAGGSTKYQKMDSDYSSIVLRGTTDLTKLPVAGGFFSEPLKAEITQKLASENIKPARIYFSGDDWEEFSSLGVQAKRYRKVFATFTYRDGEKCQYGVAGVVQNFDSMQGKFATSDIEVQKGLTAPCELVD
jgi:hypothetical protein